MKYPKKQMLLCRGVNGGAAGEDLKKENSESKDISFLIHNPMHEILWSQVSKCPLYWNHCVMAPFAGQPLCQPKV